MKRMTYSLLFVLVFLFLFPAVSVAQRGKDKDFQGEFSQPEIFLRPLKSVGRTAGTSVTLTEDPAVCDGLSGRDVCFVLPAQPAALDWNELNMESLTLPAKTLRDLLVLNIFNGLDIELLNETAGDFGAVLRMRATFTLVSPAFAGVVDPTTGLPLNGAWTVGAGARRISTTLRAGDFHTDQISYTRRLFISRSLLKGNLEMTDAQVDQFFDNPITIQVNMDGRARLAVDSFHSTFVAIEGY